MRKFNYYFTLWFAISLILVGLSPAFCFTLTPPASGTIRNENIEYTWSPGYKVTFVVQHKDGYKESIPKAYKTPKGTWLGNTWYPPITGEGNYTICKGKWVPTGGSGGGGGTPIILWCNAKNKGDFPKNISFIDPAENKYIIAGGSVGLVVEVTDQDGDPVPGCKIDWSINQTGTYFSKSGGTGYTQGVSSASNTQGGTYCNVTATIQGTSISTTSKTITVVVFPTLSPIADWNDEDTQESNNCYNFACDLETDTLAQPGRAGGYTPTAFTSAEYTKAAEADGLVSTVDLNPSNGHIVALVIWPGEDFHWYRMESDGTWSHKHGNYPATTLDNSGNPITDPRTADRGPYTVFCGFFSVGASVEIN